ncbi:hypothetical protein RB195_006707 [Necator americanus]
MRRTVGQHPADIVLARSRCLLTDLEFADDVVIFAESSTKLQHVVLYRSWLQPMDYAYALINASRCGSLRDHERESGWTDNQSNSSMISAA